MSGPTAVLDGPPPELVFQDTTGQKLGRSDREQWAERTRATAVATITTTTEAPASPTTTLAWWRAELDRSDLTIMIGVDRWIEAELCDGLVNVIRQIKTVLERADPLEVRVFVE